MSQQINLFNPIFLKQKKTFSAVNMLDALALLLIGVALFYGYASIESLNLDRQAVETGRQYELAKARLAQASVRYAPKKVDTGLEAEVNNLEAQLTARKATLDSLGIDALASGASYAEYLRALARQSVPGLWLTRFKVAKGDAEMEIAGRALQPELVPVYIERLNKERAMRGRAFDSLSMTQREDALPASASRSAAAPAKYSYTEFQLVSTHAGSPAEGDEGPARKPAIEPPRAALPSQPRPFPAPDQNEAATAKYADGIDAMALRERAMFFGAVALVLVTLLQVFLLNPVVSRRNQLSAQIAQQDDETKAIQTQIVALVRPDVQDPNAVNREKLKSLREQMARYDRRFEEQQQQFVQSERMGAMLQSMVAKNPKLQLLSLRNLPSAGLSSSAGAAGSAGGRAGAARGREVYRHTVELSIKGSYFDLLDYLAALERMPQKMFWDGFELSVTQYPESVLKLTIYTLSPEKSWLTV